MIIVEHTEDRSTLNHADAALDAAALEATSFDRPDIARVSA
jgi:hypothetical protein